LKLDAREVVEARERLGLTQEELAARAEVSENTVLRAEHGLEVRPVTARRLARGLGLEVADLYPKDRAPASPPKETDAERRANMFDMVHDAAVRQAKEERQAFARAEESQPLVQNISQQHYNEVFKQLVQLPVDQSADLVWDTMEYATQQERRVAELEDRVVELEQELEQAQAVREQEQAK
jgi:transcriptional regulator with XRE-family HTH domain